MNILLNFYEFQSWVEFLSATIYFVTSAYIIYLLILKWRIPGKERRLLLSLSFGFLAIAVVFLVRQTSYPPSLEHGFFQSDLSTALLMILLVLPCQYYCSSRMGFYDPPLIFYILNISAIGVLNMMVPSEPAPFYLYAFLSLFLINNLFLIFRFFRNISSLTKAERSSLIILKNDIFIFISVTFLSLILIFLILFGSERLYVRIVLSVFTFINMLLFVKISLPFSSKSLLTAASNIEDLASVQEERRKINRQLSENVKADELYERLLKYFKNDKPYLKPDLKIKEVALYLYTNKTYLSRIINDKNNKNFNQFVNYYRIEEVKQLFNDNNRLNIQELCNLSGFGSMATFSIAFRFQLGYTPADWCKEQRLKVNG